MSRLSLSYLADNRSSPDAVWDLNFGNAIHYHFTAENGSTLSHVDALDTLKLDGCHFATGRWVDNHWSLILWKIAGQILAKPELFVSKWSWGEIINQLKYRCGKVVCASCC